VGPSLVKYVKLKNVFCIIKYFNFYSLDIKLPIQNSLKSVYYDLYMIQIINVFFLVILINVKSTTIIKKLLT